MGNYKEKLKIEIFFEIFHQEAAMTVFSQQKAKFQPIERNLMRFEVQGLTENSPSISFGDTIRVMDPHSESVIYIGKVTKVERDSLIIQFNENFNVTNNEFDVEFVTSKTHMFNCIRAIDILEDCIGEPAIFPNFNSTLKLKKFHPIIDAVLNEDGNLAIDNVQHSWHTELDIYQKKAIVNALRCEYRPHPMIFHGPPGNYSY